MHTYSSLFVCCTFGQLFMGIYHPTFSNYIYSTFRHINFHIFHSGFQPSRLHLGLSFSVKTPFPYFFRNHLSHMVPSPPRDISQACIIHSHRRVRTNSPVSVIRKYSIPYTGYIFIDSTYSRNWQDDLSNPPRWRHVYVYISMLSLHPVAFSIINHIS